MRLILIMLALLVVSCSGESVLDIKEPVKEPYTEYKGETFLKKVGTKDIAWVQDQSLMQWPRLIVLTINDSQENLFTQWLAHEDGSCFIENSWYTASGIDFTQTLTKLVITEYTEEDFWTNEQESIFVHLELTRVFTFELINSSIWFSFTSNENRNGVITIGGGFLAKYDDKGLALEIFNQLPKCAP